MRKPVKLTEGFVVVQPCSDGDLVHHPEWKHTHLVWKPVYVTGDECLSIEHQQQVFQTKAMAACRGTHLERSAVEWNKTWIMSFPVRGTE